MHNEKFHGLYSATDVIIVIKTKTIRSTEGKQLIKKKSIKKFSSDWREETTQMTWVSGEQPFVQDSHWISM